MAIVIAVDTIALGLRGPWKALEARVHPRYMVEHVTTEYRQELREILAEPEKRRVFVVGSSRAMFGFNVTPWDTPQLHEVSIVRLTHPGNGAFQIRSAVDEMLGFDPDVVVWMLSEFDTHRPVWILHLTSYGSFSAIGDLIATAGMPFALGHRTLIERLAVEGLFDSYRYRRLLGYAGLDRVRRFRFDARFPRAERPELEPTIDDGTPRFFEADEFERILANIRSQTNLERLGPRDVDRIHRITRGRHAEINMDLLRRAVARLHDAGVRVIVVETPLSPAAAVLYDTSIRLDFLEFMNELVADYGVRFVPLEQIGPFAIEDFRDLSHAAEPGRAKLTRAILRAVRDDLAAIPSP